MRFGARRLRLSDIVSLFLNPSVATGAFFCWLVARFEPPGPSRIVFASLAVIFASLIPVGLLFILKARGWLSDVEMSVRSERERNYLLCAAGYGLGAVLLFVLGASWPVWGLLGFHVPNTLILIIFNRRLKVSIHSMVLTSLCIAALMFFGNSAAPLALAVPVAAWARWDAGNHSVSELVWGVLIGAALSPAEIYALQKAFGS